MTREDLLHLATTFRDAAADDLAQAQQLADIHWATFRAHERLDHLEAQLFSGLEVKVDCKAGCSACCHLAKIDARAHEIFALAAWITEKFSEAERTALVAKTKAHAEAVAGLTLAQHLRTVRACPMLVDSKCSVHPARPGVCRIGHSKDVSICQRAFENPDDLKARGGHDADVKSSMTAAADGSTFAFIEAGVDRTTYDLSSALYEALSEPAALTRWLGGEQAFSDAAKAKQEGLVHEKRD
jgi:Fe-S-cluster containining protein